MFKSISQEKKSLFWLTARTLLGPLLYEKIRTRKALGYWPNIKNPQTFNEKIIHRKLLAPPPLASALSDKYAVRDFIKNKIGSHILNELYFVGENPEDIDFEKLPNKFVVKTTHGAGGVFIITDKNTEDLNALREKIRKSLKEKFGILTNEIWYTKIKPRIIIEELLEDKTHGIPFDYKFYCFHGKCKFIHIDLDRFTNHTRTFYNENWELQSFSVYCPIGQETEIPSNFEEMKHIAETLSKDFDFVRIDLYSVNEETKFSEITFAPGAGWSLFNPQEQAYVFGKLW